MELILTALILIVALAYVFSPLFLAGSKRETFNDNPRVLEGMEYDKNAIYQQILELDFDYQLGNMDEQDYKKAREDLKIQAVSIVNRLNETAAVKPDVCKGCGASLSAVDVFCPYCGVKQN